MLPPIEERIAVELSARPEQVAAAIKLIDEGSTVPFIARYRKEATGGLDDTQLRALETRLTYLRDLEERRAAILKSVDEQGKLSAELRSAIEDADTKAKLEDLYLPYKPKRRTKAQIAREAGLEPLALNLLENPQLDPETHAASYVNAEKGVADVKAALDGARQILMERFSENAQVLQTIRAYLRENGSVQSRVVEGKNSEGIKFADYFEYNELYKNIPSHRALALFRGRNEGILAVSLQLPEQDLSLAPSSLNFCETQIARAFNISQQKRPADAWLFETVRWTWRIKVALHIEVELMLELRERAEAEAIRVFASNLHDLLLAAPAGPRVTIGLDPGVRTGVKVAVIDATGKVLETATIYPHPPKNDWDGSLAMLAALAAKHKAELVSIGNGTASRETDRLVQDLLKRLPQLKLIKVVVSEAGASVYSASELAAKEFPNLDVSLRGAVSIARRLQDPLAELVKIEPKSIGVGQYQHDVDQTMLARSLDSVVEDCVNAVGVDVNTASVELLTRVSGLNTSLAASIVAYRDQCGAFKRRNQLLRVPRLGEKTYEQAAGFLRISNGDNPLDASAVHPETYPLVERILSDLDKEVRDVIGDVSALRTVDPKKYVDAQFGLPTVTDILKELEKPGRDPRPDFKSATFKEGVEEIRDLKPGMLLEGVVTNLTNFGAFVDIGVHQDGLVHISAICERFIKDPREVLKTGEVVKVRVLEIDEARKRIALTMRLNDTGLAAGIKLKKENGGGTHPSQPRVIEKRPPQNQRAQPRQDAPLTLGSAFADVFSKLKSS